MKHPRKEKKPDLKRRLREGGLATGLVCVLAALLLALNLLFTTLEERNAWRVDYSFNALTTYSETTAQVLAGLTHPVHIYALYSRGDEDQPLLELLNRYAAASPLVTWEQTDISLNPGLLTKFRSSTSDESLTNDSVVVWCEETGRWRILSALDFVSLSYDTEQGVYQYAGLTYESSLTSAISYVTKETVPRILILQGHGELDEDGTAAFADLLASNHYDVYYYTLNTTETELSPDDLLVILSPVRDFTDSELSQLTAFTESGGSILFTCDYTDPVDSMPNYASLLRSYGFLPQTGVAVASSDESSSYYNGNRTYLIPRMQTTDITADLVQAGDTFLILAASRAFSMPESSDRYLNTEAVLTTTENAYLRDFSSGSMSLSKQDGDPAGTFALALLAQRMSATGEVSNAFILGCSTLLTSQEEYAMTVSQEFILRTVEFLLGEEQSDLSLMARSAVRPALSASSTALGTAVIVALPLLVLGAAVLVLLSRRHR